MTNLIKVIKSKLPACREAFQVLSVIVFIVFSWTLYRMFYQLPSWLGFLSIGYILSLSAYVLAFAFFESAMVLLFVVLLSLIFPINIFKSKFVAQGVTIVLLLSLVAIMVQRKAGALDQVDMLGLITYPIVFLIVLIIGIVLTSKFYNRFQGIMRILNAIAEWMTIFAFIYLPLGLISLIIVIIRNLVRSF